jgi:heme-degrading monooxygenase HmoA
MYARLVIGSMAPDKLDEFIQFWRESVLPSVQQQKGFKGVRMLVDRKNGKIATSGLWDTEADLLDSVAWNQAQVDKIVGKFGASFTAPPEVGLYEVVIEV